MKLLLTSSGISNKSIRNALVELLGKPIAEANALFVPTGVYPFRGGQYYAWNPIGGEAAPRMCQLGWKSVGILELSVLPASIGTSGYLPFQKRTLCSSGVATLFFSVIGCRNQGLPNSYHPYLASWYTWALAPVA